MLRDLEKLERDAWAAGLQLRRDASLHTWLLLSGKKTVHRSRSLASIPDFLKGWASHVITK